MGDEFDDLFDLAPPNIPPEVPPGREQPEAGLNPDQVDNSGKIKFTGVFEGLAETIRKAIETTPPRTMIGSPDWDQLGPADPKAKPKWAQIAQQAQVLGAPPWTLVDDTPVPQGTGITSTKPPTLTDEQKALLEKQQQILHDLASKTWDNSAGSGKSQAVRGAFQRWYEQETDVEPEDADERFYRMRRYLPPEPTVDWVALETNPLVETPRFREVEVYVDRGSHWDKASRPVFAELNMTLKPIHSTSPGDATIDAAGTMYQLADPGSTSQSPDTSSDASGDGRDDDEDDWDEDWDEEMEDDV